MNIKHGTGASCHHQDAPLVPSPTGILYSQHPDRGGDTKKVNGPPGQADAFLDWQILWTKLASLLIVFIQTVWNIDGQNWLTRGDSYWVMLWKPSSNINRAIVSTYGSESWFLEHYKPFSWALDYVSFGIIKVLRRKASLTLFFFCLWFIIKYNFFSDPAANISISPTSLFGLSAMEQARASRASLGGEKRPKGRKILRYQVTNLKGLSYETDFENLDVNWQILALTRASAGFWIFLRHLWFLVEIKHLLSGKC